MTQRIDVFLRIAGAVAMMSIVACAERSSAPPTPIRDDAAPRDATAAPNEAAVTPDVARIDAAAEPACAVEAPTACPVDAPTYGQVAVIIERHCVGCHWGEPGGPWPLTKYEHIADWSAVVRAHVLACTMPPPGAQVGASMTAQERLAILNWIRCDLPK